MATDAAVMAPAVFNGGKMEHIFEFSDDPGTKDNKYSPTFSDKDAQDALENTSCVYWKIDGACGLIRNADGVLEVYERQDTRGQAPTSDLIPLPGMSRSDNDGARSKNANLPCTNPSVYADAKDKPHNYFMRKVELQDTDGKKQKKLKKVLLNTLNDNRDELIEKIKKYGTADGYLSVELVGQKFQKTPGVSVDAGIAVHAEQRIDLDDCNGGDDDKFPRTYKGVKDFLLNRNVEGIVLEYKGKFWKIRSNLMDPQCSFENDRSNADSPIKVYTESK